MGHSDKIQVRSPDDSQRRGDLEGDLEGDNWLTIQEYSSTEEEGLGPFRNHL